jgi:hypothetical protein
MRFLDLDLDFFLNKNTYRSSHQSGRLDSEYRPWSVPRVRRFLEDRCSLSPDNPARGTVVESHEEVLDIWRALIESGRLKAPFEVIHIDAHPDLWVGGGMYLTPECLHIDPARGLALLKTKPIHSGNYLTFALAYGWLESLVWIPLLKHGADIPEWDADARAVMLHFYKEPGEPAPEEAPAAENDRSIPFRIIPWNKFKTREVFDYVALSKSPGFTPQESDRLVSVIQGYMKEM